MSVPVRFARHHDRTLASRLPWGANEERLKRLALAAVEKMYRPAYEQSKQGSRMDEKQRREALGLDFLKDQSESFIQRAVQSKS